MPPSAQFPAETASDGAFVRQKYSIRNRITADGSSGFPAVAGRYHLYVSLACPWAHRAIIVRKLLGLEDVISMSVVDPIRDERGWAFREGDGHTKDPVCDFQFLSEAYLATDPNYTGRYTVPCVWDRVTQRLVTNNFPDITIDLETQFTAYHKPGAPDLYPERLRPEIDEVNAVVYKDVNNGVYMAGFATTQRVYERAVDLLFARLDWLEERLRGRTCLVGEQLTEADIRLFTTLVRFDAVYVGHFKCNIRRLVDYPNLWDYARLLYQQPGFGDTVNFDHIKRHYYMTHDQINPNRIVPKGPVVDWLQPTKRVIVRVPPQDEVLIRDALANELPTVAELTRRAYAEYATIMTPSSWAGLSSAIERALASTEPVQRIVAEDNGRIVGSAMLYPPSANAYGGDAHRVSWPEVRLVAVAPDARGKGIARRIMDECIRRARLMGARELGLHTSHSFRAAIHMYAAMGFERVPEYDFQPPGAERVEAYRLALD